MATNELYVDGFGNIVVTGTIVRIDLIGLSAAGTPEDKQPRFEHRQRLILPLDGFLRAFGMQEDVIKKLMDAGVVAKREPQAKPEIADANAAPPAPTPPSSPNFQ